MSQDLTLKISYTWSGLRMDMPTHANWVKTLLLSTDANLQDLKCEPVGMAEYQRVYTPWKAEGGDT